MTILTLDIGSSSVREISKDDIKMIREGSEHYVEAKQYYCE